MKRGVALIGHLHIAILDLKARKRQFVKPSKSAEEVDNLSFSGLQGTDRTKSLPGDTPGYPEPIRATRTQLSTRKVDYYNRGSSDEPSMHFDDSFTPM